MRLSDIRRKEIINLYDGARLGILGEADLVINPTTGKILSIEVQKIGILGLRGSNAAVIPWSSVKKIGSDMIIVEVSRR